MGCSSSRTAPAWVFPTGCSLSGTGCPSVGPPWGHKPCQQTCLGMGSSLHGSAGPGRSLLQHGAPHVVTASLRYPPALGWGPFHGLQVDICSIMDLHGWLHHLDLHGLQGDNLPHHGLHHELQGKTLCSSILSTSSPLLPTDLGVCRLVSLTSSHSSLFTAVSPQFFLSFLKYAIPEVLPPSLIGLALASGRSVLEPADTGLIRHGVSFSQLLRESHPCSPHRCLGTQSHNTLT